jgi:hypothetical protein
MTHRSATMVSMLHSLRTYPKNDGLIVEDPITMLRALRELAQASGTWLAFVLGWTVLHYNRSIEKDAGAILQLRPCPNMIETELGVNAFVFFQAVEKRANFIHCRSTAIVELAVKCPGMYQCQTFDSIPLILWYLRPPATISPSQMTVLLREKGVFWASLLTPPAIGVGRHE